MTPEQVKEFTPFNACAFDLARLRASQKDTKIPAWLTSDDNAKQKMRQEFVQEFNQLRNVNFTETQVEQECNLPVFANMVTAWKNFEQELEDARAKGDPLAFFV